MNQQIMDSSADPEPIKPCTICLAPNSVTATVCTSCGMPLGEINRLDPYRTIGVDNYLWVRAISRPKLIVVFLVWVTTLPVFVICVLWVVSQMLEGGGALEFILLLAAAALAVASFGVLYRVTKNYFVLRDEKAIEKGD